MSAIGRCLEIIQQPLPSILQETPSVDGREWSPASSGESVIVPSSRTKQGVPTEPFFLAKI